MFLARRGAARALRAFHTRAELVTCLAATPCQARSLDQRRELSQTRDFSKVTDNQATELYFEEIFEQVRHSRDIILATTLVFRGLLEGTRCLTSGTTFIQRAKYGID